MDLDMKKSNRWNENSVFVALTFPAQVCRTNLPPTRVQEPLQGNPSQVNNPLKLFKAVVEAVLG